MLDEMILAKCFKICNNFEELKLIKFFVCFSFRGGTFIFSQIDALFYVTNLEALS